MRSKGTHARTKAPKKERTSRRREPGYQAMRDHFPSEAWHMKEVRKNQRERHVRDLMRQGVSRFRAEWMLDNPEAAQSTKQTVALQKGTRNEPNEHRGVRRG